MGFLLKALAKAAAKAAKVDPTDVLNQQTVNDAFHILKEVLL